MPAVTAIVISITVVMNLAIVIGDIVRAEFVVANSREVGVADEWLPALALLKGAGAAGLVIGIAGVPLVGILAASGLTLFYLSALIAHVRARVFHSIAFPALFFAFALGSLVLLLVS
ncbi:DoxX family protein [Agrococcus sp. ARC_14]|uniref:DoxX family protein n=1 Tax=Agrococcus sp. ARC_14 TaxID=2919927 RepID=UPI001F0542C2|nr:DoxX family protein [Agrococcus sp. ARC_14]MCH1883372.1 DoxX family protein [Agrococcus sp. ARC_14]